MLVSHRQKLVVVAGPDRGLEREIEASRISIGTSSKNDLQLSDHTVSRVHCEIAVRNERYYLRDLESTNGTEVDGTAVVEAFLSPGMRIQLGDTEILFEPKKKWERVSDGENDHFGEMYGTAPVMKGVFAMLDKVAKTDLSCILVGETGTGKELAARGLHAESARAPRNIVVVDCGAVSKNLIESELFGHEKGAFTGADRQRVGAFEHADGGTIFLDEIGEMSLGVAAEVCCACSSKRAVSEASGSNTYENIDVDVRVIAATNRDLRAEDPARRTSARTSTTAWR